MSFRPVVRPVARAVARAVNSKTGFSPLELFAQGEQGVWYDPSDLTTLYQDAAGTIPVTADGDPVGLMLDKSQGLELGPELVTNGDFSQPQTTGWLTFLGASLSIESGRLKVTNGGGSAANTYVLYPISTQTGNWYRYEIDYESSPAGGDMPIYPASNINGSPLASTANVSGSGSRTVYFKATGATSYLLAQQLSLPSGASFFIDNISARELKGNHATQSVAASRPVYQRGDSRGVVNLYRQTADLTSSVWLEAKTAGAMLPVISSGVIDSPQEFPGQQSNEITINRTTTSEGSFVYQRFPIPFTGTYTASMYIKAARSGDVGKTVDIWGHQTGFKYRNSHTLTSDWVRVTPTGAGISYSSGAVGEVMTFGYLDNGSLSPDVGEIKFLVYAPQLEQGTTPTPYQRNDSHLGGVATGSADDLHWLADDKVDDVMSATLPAMPTATVAHATDDGVVINYPVNIPAGAYSVDTTSTHGFDYGRVIVDRQLTAPEQSALTTYLEGKS